MSIRPSEWWMAHELFINADEQLYVIECSLSKKERAAALTKIVQFYLTKPQTIVKINAEQCELLRKRITVASRSNYEQILTICEIATASLNTRSVLQEVLATTLLSLNLSPPLKREMLQLITPLLNKDNCKPEHLKRIITSLAQFAKASSLDQLRKFAALFNQLSPVIIDTTLYNLDPSTPIEDNLFLLEEILPLLRELILTTFFQNALCCANLIKKLTPMQNRAEIVTLLFNFLNLFTLKCQVPGKRERLLYVLSSTDLRYINKTIQLATPLMHCSETSFPDLACLATSRNDVTQDEIKRFVPFIELLPPVDQSQFIKYVVHLPIKNRKDLFKTITECLNAFKALRTNTMRYRVFLELMQRPHKERQSLFIQSLPLLNWFALNDQKTIEKILQLPENQVYNIFEALQRCNKHPYNKKITLQMAIKTPPERRASETQLFSSLIMYILDDKVLIRIKQLFDSIPEEGKTTTVPTLSNLFKKRFQYVPVMVKLLPLNLLIEHGDTIQIDNDHLPQQFVLEHRDAIIQHLMQSLNIDPTTEEELEDLKHIVCDLATSQSDLQEMLHLDEESDLMTLLVSKLSIIETQPEQHPTSVFLKLRKLQEIPFVGNLPWRSAERGSLRIQFNVQNLTQLFKERLKPRITSSALIEWLATEPVVSKETLQEEIAQIRADLQRKSTNPSQEIQSLLSQLVDYEKTAIPFLTNLFNALYPSVEPAPLALIQFTTLLKNLHLWTNSETAPNAVLTSRQIRLFIILDAANVCDSGNIDNINLLYIGLIQNPQAIQSGSRTEINSSAQYATEFCITQYTHWVETELSHYNRFMRSAAGTHRSRGEIVHQAIFIKNMIAHTLGDTFWPTVKFDRHTGVLPTSLIAKSAKTLLTDFSNHSHIEHLINNLHREINRKLSSPEELTQTYNSINTLLDDTYSPLPTIARWTLTPDNIPVIKRQTIYYLLHAIGIFNIKHETSYMQRARFHLNETIRHLRIR